MVKYAFDSESEPQYLVFYFLFFSMAFGPWLGLGGQAKTSLCCCLGVGWACGAACGRRGKEEERGELGAGSRSYRETIRVIITGFRVLSFIKC